MATHELGRALLKEWGHKSSYQAKGWHAQIVQITKIAAGAAAAHAVGLVIKTERTLIAWLSESQEPNAANKRKIGEAYRLLAGARWNPANERRRYGIYGKIDSGDRTEVRKLEIGLGDYSAPMWGHAKWDRLRDEFNSPVPDPEKIEQFFIEDVIHEDIGETSPDWDFPGSSYTIS